MSERISDEEPRHIRTYHEDFGPVIWWTRPVAEPPWIGSPLYDDWPGYHQWWTPLPPIPRKLLPKWAQRDAAQETEAEGRNTEGGSVYEGSVAEGHAPDDLLARLTAAEAARDELKARLRTQAMEQLGSDAGWELENDKLRAERDAFRDRLAEMCGKHMVALARVERLEGALRGISNRCAGMAESFSYPAVFRPVGEMCAGIRDEARSALTEASPQGE